MTKLDDAIKAAYADSEKQGTFYNLFLNTLFYIPIIEYEEELAEEEGALPLLIEDDNKTYLMLFDTVTRLFDWSHKDVAHLASSGRSIAEMSTSNIHWALNYGTEQQKIFDPEEISWLKGVIKRVKEKEPSAEENPTTKQ